jgi:hypothetical protein
MVGPSYCQVALKTTRAAEHLTWLSADAPGTDELRQARETVAIAERAFLKEFTAKLDELL